MFARIRLGIGKEEFFALTPRLFAALRREWLNQHAEQQRSIALLRADLINFSFCRPKEPVKLEELLGRAADQATGTARSWRLTVKARREIGNAWRRFLNAGANGEWPQTR